MARSRKRRSQPQVFNQEQRSPTAKPQAPAQEPAKKRPAAAKQPLADTVASLLADRDFWIAALIFSGVLAGSLWGASCVRIFCFSSVDSFWLIQAGLDVVSQMRLPGGDYYSFTNYGRPWLLYQWLFEVVVGLIGRAGGLQALQAFVEVFSALIFTVLGFQGLIRRGANIWVAGWVTAAAGAAALTFLSLRPHLVSMLMVYLVQRMVDSHWRQPGWRVLWLGALFVVWANCHLLFSIGLAIVFIYWIASGLVWLTSRTDAGEPERALNWQRFRLLAVAFVLSVGTSLANPYGWDTITYGLVTAGQEYWTAHIGEVMAPAFSNPFGALILGYILVTVVALMLATRRPTLGEGLVFVGLLATGLTSYKLLPYFVTFSMHGTGLRLQSALAELAGSRIPTRVKVVSDYLARWAATPAYAVTVLFLVLAFGLGRPVLLPPWVPVAAADYLESHPLEGHLFCSAKFGSYLIWRFHGRLPVFIDTRFDMYGPAFSEAYFKANREGVGWQELFDRYAIRYAVVETSSGMARVLNTQPGWKRLYLDANAVIFGKLD